MAPSRKRQEQKTVMAKTMRSSGFGAKRQNNDASIPELQLVHQCEQYNGSQTVHQR